MNIPEGYSIRVFRPDISGKDQVYEGYLLGEGPIDTTEIIEALLDYFDAEDENISWGRKHEPTRQQSSLS